MAFRGEHRRNLHVGKDVAEGFDSSDQPTLAHCMRTTQGMVKKEKQLSYPHLFFSFFPY